MDTARTLDGPMPGGQPDDEPTGMKGRVHCIDIESLIIHKYPDPGALLKKADKISRDLVHAELREGEFLRVTRPGRYQLVLPKLLPDAGALRASVISEKLFRAITDLNPTKKSLIETGSAVPADDQTPKPRNIAKPKTPPPRPRLVNPKAIPSDEEKRRAASHAIELMSSRIATKAEELLASTAGKDLLANASARFQPVWNPKKKVLSAYRISLHLNGAEIDARDTSALHGLDSVDSANALIDAVRYRAACTSLTQLWSAGEQALIVVPVNFSTIDHSRYIGAFLDAGVLPAGGGLKDRIVYEIVNVRADISRYRLREAVAYLRGRSRGINICLGADWSAVNFADLKEFGIQLAGIDISTFSVGEQRLMKTLEEFSAKAESAGFACYCTNLTTFSTLACAVAAGMSYVSGPALAPPLSSPKGIATLDFSRLIALSARRWNSNQ